MESWHDIQGSLKMAQFFWYALTSSNINRFSKLFHCQNQEKICNNTITKDLTISQMCAILPCEMASVFKATIENKTTSVTKHLKKLTGNNVFIVSVISKVTVTSCRSSAGILHGCLQQDGAPSHTARNTPTYLRRENVTFIEPHMWPPNSPHLNPVDCAVRAVL